MSEFEVIDDDSVSGFGCDCLLMHADHKVAPYHLECFADVRFQISMNFETEFIENLEIRKL